MHGLPCQKLQKHWQQLNSSEPTGAELLPLLSNAARLAVSSSEPADGWQVAAAEAAIAWAGTPEAAEAPAAAQVLRQLYALAWPCNLPIIRLLSAHAAQLCSGPLVMAAFAEGLPASPEALLKGQIALMQVTLG